MKKFDAVQKARKKFLDGIGVPEASKFVPDAFQMEAIESATGGHDTLVVAPTGSGKTHIAVESIDAEISQGGSAVYTTPLKALSNTKYTDFKRKFEPRHKVGLLTGDRKIDPDSKVVVATTEIYRNELYRGEGKYSLIVLDEVHFIADGQRGPVWEESIILTPTSSTLLMLSATISNAREIAGWIKEVRGKECRIIESFVRPVELRLGFLHPSYGAYPLNDSEGKVNKEVSSYYGTVDLDASGMKLSGGRFKRPGRGRGGDSRGGSKRRGGNKRGRGKKGGR